MCGICGFSVEHPSASDAELLARMTATIVHRGPDDDGQFLKEGMALGMRRLSIIDVKGGKQPVFNEDKSVAAVQNGEIYNFQDLRELLIGKGHQFTTQCDTEVIVHLYEEYGAAFANHLNGMFAIAVWDSRIRRLILVRDRLGVKPLFYSQVGDRIVFGSEIKCLTQHPAVDAHLDHQALYNYFCLGYIPAPRTAFRKINKLPPGCRLQFEDGRIQIDRYWELPDREQLDSDRAQAIHQLRDLLSDAVRIRMISDVPLGAFLSGGVDSSIVVAMMAQQSPLPVKTFFIDFDDDRYSEREYARTVAKRYGTDHHELTVRANAVDVLDKMIRHFDEPFADSSAIPTWYVSELTRQHVSVAVAGDGGDESFGGYMRYNRILQRREWPTFRRMIRPVAEMAATLLPRSAPGKRYVRSFGMPNAEFYITGAQEYETQRILSRDFCQSVQRSITEETNGLYSDLRTFDDPLTPYARFDLRWYLPDDILTKVDRMSMAHSLEVRGPFLDYRVVELAHRMPHFWKLSNGDSKVILKDAFRSELPPNVLRPRKRGFSVPMGEWIRGDLRAVCESMLYCDDSSLNDIVNLREARGLFAEHLNGSRDRSGQLWRIVVFHKWLQQLNVTTGA